MVAVVGMLLRPRQLFVRTNETMAMARSLAELDVASSMAHLARARHYCRPTLVDG